MADIKKGGVYKVHGQYVNAMGEPVEAPASRPVAEAPKDHKLEAWPEGFPSRTELEAAGVKSAADAQGMPHDALIALDGIGPAKADRILAFGK